MFDKDAIINQMLPDHLVVSGHQLAVIRSHDQGETWERRTWTVPGYKALTGFPRGTVLEDGTWLFPVYTSRCDGDGDGLIFRSDDAGATWRLHLAVPRACYALWVIISTNCFSMSMAKANT